jgi:hypothetical protein
MRIEPILEIRDVVLNQICSRDLISTAPKEIREARAQVEELFDTSIQTFRSSADKSVSDELTLDHNNRLCIQHQADHDIEGMFWLLWFTLARANPKSTSTVSLGQQQCFDSFIRTMLNHRVGRAFAERDSLLDTQDGCVRSLHPALHSQGILLNTMRLYLQTPLSHWRRLTGSETHAHHVMKGLILGELMRMQEEGEFIELNCERPRPAYHDSPGVPKKSLPMV